ncbi:AMP-binding protein [Actinomycetospora endophytica]|uniref:AMP-binding protein n=1 Tax=Actinomycetospora endophytica TaxID=2291215 RepID=A0ABS8P8L1_9PSEU|nr:AMP-binding protein [Actinomycetospora endophytica]MCD2194611.1 AMP-binding protein [Actinomycetospora endophytica]
MSTAVAVDAPPVALPATTRRLERAEWAPDESVPLAECTVGDLLRDRAQRFPDVCALIGTRHDGSTARLTYTELLAEARSVAAGLLALADPGEHVALWAPNVAEWPVIEYGAALAGVVLVALNPVLTDDELAYSVRLAGASVLVHAETSRDRDLAASVARVRRDLPALRETVSLAHPDRLYAEPGPEPDDLHPDDPVMIQFTSGTTGRPKAVVLAHRSLVNNARLTMITAEVGPGAVGIAPLPMFHTAACVISTLGPAWVGGTQVLIERFEPGPVLASAVREGARVLFSVPTVLSALLEAARKGAAAPRLDTVLVGASICAPTTITAAQETFGASVHNLFGQTELSPVLSLTRRGDTADDLATTVGRPLPQTAARVVDPTSGDVVGLGVQGEICARGYLQLLRYHDDPAATATTVDPEGWVHTGDLGTMDERGLITVTGRLKELVIRGGENIAPAEVEIALAEHPDVLTSAVVGLPDDHWGEIVAAAVVLRDGGAPGVEEALRAHCRERLSSFKVPERWFVVDELPMTASGKVQKFALRDQLADQPYAGGTSTDSSTRSN